MSGLRTSVKSAEGTGVRPSCVVPQMNESSVTLVELSTVELAVQRKILVAGREAILSFEEMAVFLGRSKVWLSENMERMPGKHKLNGFRVKSTTFHLGTFIDEGKRNAI